MNSLRAVVLLVVVCIAASGVYGHALIGIDGNGQRAVGAYEDKEVDSEQVKSIVTQAMAQLNEGVSQGCERSIKRVLKAQTQVVAGTNYKLDVEHCVPENCPNAPKPACQKCVMTVWEQVWKKTLSVTSMDCEQSQ